MSAGSKFQNEKSFASALQTRMLQSNNEFLYNEWINHSFGKVITAKFEQCFIVFKTFAIRLCLLTDKLLRRLSVVSSTDVSAFLTIPYFSVER